MSKLFWEESIPSGYYDKLLKDGIRKNKGIQSSWHHITFLTVAENLRKKTNHLDYASGPGTFTGIYINDINSFGVDISNEQINYAIANYKNTKFFTLDKFDKSKYKDYFDTITVIGLIEFLSDDEISNLITDLKILLKNDGQIIFTTPNFRGFMKLFSILLSWLGPVNYNLQWVNKFNKKKIKKLLIKNNISDFKIEKHLNFGLALSFLNLNLGTKISRIISALL